VIRSLCGWNTVQFMDVYNFHYFGDPSTLWTCRIIQHFRWSVHFVADIPSNLWTCWIAVIRPLCGGYTVQLWTCIIFTVLVIRPLYGHVGLFNVLGDPSTLWRKYRPLFGLVELLSVLVIRPLCGGYTVQFMDLCNSHRLGDPSGIHLVNFK